MRQQFEDARGILAAPGLLSRVGQRTRSISRGSWRFCRTKPLGAFGLAIFLATVFAAILAPYMRTTEPTAIDYLSRLEAPSADHWLGTDEFGRDIYSRIVYGARVSLQVAFFAIGIGTSIGLILGIISGFFGGWIDNTLQRVTEILMAFPAILLALSLVAVLGSGLEKVVIALIVIFAPRTLRVMRGTVACTTGSDLGPFRSWRR